MKLFVAALVFMTSVGARACMGGSIEVNDASWLGAEGIYGRKGLEQPVEKMNESIKSMKRAIFYLADKADQKTHLVEFVGSVGDAEGTIQSVYVLKDLKTNEEKTVVLKSNYMGNGIHARGAGPKDNVLKVRKGFDKLYEAGC